MQPVHPENTRGLEGLQASWAPRANLPPSCLQVVMVMCPWLRLSTGEAVLSFSHMPTRATPAWGLLCESFLNECVP